MAALKDVRITDPYLLGKIEQARVAAGDKSSTKTAARLIIQRLTQIEMAEMNRPFGTQPVPSDHTARHSGVASAVA